MTTSSTNAVKKKSRGRGRPPLSSSPSIPADAVTSTSSGSKNHNAGKTPTKSQKQQKPACVSVSVTKSIPAKAATSTATGRIKEKGSKSKNVRIRQKAATLAASSGTTAITSASSSVMGLSSSNPSVNDLDMNLSPEHVLVIDNGGDTIKFGWSNSSEPHCISNITSRLHQQFTVLVGDQLEQIIAKNPSSIVGITHSTERGIITNMSNQIQVWKRALDILGVTIPWKSNSEIANAFGWISTKSSTSSKHKTVSVTSKNVKTTSDHSFMKKEVNSFDCAVLIALPPHYPRTILEQIVSIWLDDFQFASIGFCVSSAVCAAAFTKTTTTITTTNQLLSNSLPTACVVDLGWSSTHVVPTLLVKTPSASATVSTKSELLSEEMIEPVVIRPSAIRRVPIGGRHLINIWKYYCTYRQWNLMDSDWLLRDLLEQAAYVSLNFGEEMEVASRLPAGKRPFDREYILPDFSINYKGTLRIPPSLQKELDRQKQQLQDEGKSEEEDDEDDEDFVEDDAVEDDDDDDDYMDGEEKLLENDEEDDGSNLDSDDEDEEAVKKRVLQQKQEEELRKRQLESEQQILKVSVERFTIPETLFRPSDAGLPVDWANVPQAIVQSVSACPIVYQGALYQTIQLTGGVSRLPNLHERLESEVRALVPCHYPVRIIHNSASKKLDTIYQAWYGACRLCKAVPHTNWGPIRRDEWLANESNCTDKRRDMFKRLFVSNGGYMV